MHSQHGRGIRDRPDLTGQRGQPITVPGLSQPGDSVELVNSEGVKSTTSTTLKLTPGIRKDSVYMAHGYGSMNPLMSVGAKAGVDDQSLITKISVDPETGGHGMRNNFVKLIKDGKVLDIPA